MTLSKEQILKETGYSSIEQYMQDKTDTTKKVNKLFVGKKPGMVEMSADECKKMCEKANIEYLSGYESRVLSMTTTNESPDRYGDIVVAKGAKLDNYKKNPVIQFAHDYKLPPVGASINIWIDKQNKSVPAYGLFMDERVDDSGRSATIFKMAKNGFMKASSIGFNPIKYIIPENKEEAEKMGLGKYGVKFTEWDYLEWSIVPVPANPEALQNMFKSIVPRNIAKDFGEDDINVMEKYKFFENEEAVQVFKDVIKGKDFSKIRNFSFNIDETKKDFGEKAEIKPYPNEHACRLKEPDEFKEDSFRRTNGGTIYGSIDVPESVSIIWGKLKEDESDNMVPQALRFPKDKWTAEEAKKWVEENNIKYIKFEPAVEEQGQSLSPENTEGTNIYINLGNAIMQLEGIKQEMENFNQYIKNILERFDAILNMSNPPENSKGNDVNKGKEESGLYSELLSNELDNFKIED